MFVAKCNNACPASVNVPGFVSLIGEKRFDEALRLHRERNPLASICGRVCFHPCESKCARGGLDEPVAIRSLKRFMTEQEKEAQVPEVRENAVNAAKKIAIIGGGPAGLSCAYFLARLGYKPTIFEKEPSAGGMLVQAIPAYRLPREELGREISMIERHGRDHRDRQGARQATSPWPACASRVGTRPSSEWAPPTARVWASKAKRAKAWSKLSPSCVSTTSTARPRSATRSPWSAAATPPSTRPAPPCASAPSTSTSSTAAQREQMPAWVEEILAADEEGITVMAPHRSRSRCCATSPAR